MTRVESILLQIQALPPAELKEFLEWYRTFMANNEALPQDAMLSPTEAPTETDFTADDLAIARQRMSEIASGAVQTIDEDEFYRRMNSRSEAKLPT